MQVAATLYSRARRRLLFVWGGEVFGPSLQAHLRGAELTKSPFQSKLLPHQRETELSRRQSPRHWRRDTLSRVEVVNLGGEGVMRE